MTHPGTLLVEGWRGVPFSYALINQFQCFQFLREPNLTLWHRDAPFLSSKWQRIPGLFPAEVEAAIASIPAPPEGETPDAVLRISYPYDIRSSGDTRTVVFGTAEFQSVSDRDISGKRSLARACEECDALILTPSNWSREGFIRSGAPADRVRVVPHGVDPAVFHPIDQSQREAQRRHLGWSGFVFLSLGALSPHKGIGPLLKAVAIVAQRHPEVRLVMKGLRAVYSSQEHVQAAVNELSEAERAILQPRLIFLDGTLSFEVMARLYQSADAYVSPYFGEGFNLPVLEAMASGLPIVCTRGGATDDFVTDETALRIDAARISFRLESGSEGKALDPNFDHLVLQMMTAVESPALAERTRTIGPALVERRYTWAHVAKQLLGILFDQ